MDARTIATINGLLIARCTKLQGERFRRNAFPGEPPVLPLSDITEEMTALEHAWAQFNSDSQRGGIRTMKRIEPVKGLGAIQQEYIDTVNAGIARWAHRPKAPYQAAGGHAGRIIAGARRKAVKQLRQWEYTDEVISILIKDAWEMAELERNALVDD